MTIIDVFWILADIHNCFNYLEMEIVTTEKDVFLDFDFEGQTVVHLNWVDNTVTIATYDDIPRQVWLTLEGIAAHHKVELQEWVREKEEILN